MACASNALIVGGGIAGASTALALSHVGVQCDVLELHNKPDGASIGLTGRTSDALVELGVYDQIHAVARVFDETAGAQFDTAGNLLSAGPVRPDWPGKKDNLGAYRPVLLSILSEAARAAGATITVGKTVTSIEERDDGCEVVLSDGSPRRYDMVIAADGVMSKTRELIFPDAPKPQYGGQWSIRWMAPGPQVEGEGWFNGPVGRIGFYYLPQGMIYVPSVVTLPTSDRKSEEEVRELFTRLLDSCTAPAIVELRERFTSDANLIGRPYFWILLSQPWFKGHALVIGDAAHATTSHMGMGGGMAIEDAVVLGQCVAAASTVAEAFAAFTARREQRVRTVVETSVALSSAEQQKSTRAENMARISHALEMIAGPY